jgi:chaperonin GroEL
MAQIVQSSQTRLQLQRGFDQLAELLALTLGPMQGTVLSGGKNTPIELLTDSGVIARRVVALGSRAENVGAMLVRNMATGVHDDYGDGAATAAVIARALLCEATRLIMAGTNPMELRAQIERSVHAAVGAICAQAQPARGRTMLTQLAEQVTDDTELSAILGEIFDLLGVDGAVEFEEYHAPHLDHDYLAGGRWYARPAARALLPNHTPELVLENPVVALVDQKLEHVHQVRAILELVIGTFERAPLLLVAPDITGEALKTLTLNHTRGAVTVAAVVMSDLKTPASEELKDIAALTGAHILASAAGVPPERVQPRHFGRAQRVVLTHDTLTIVGGEGEAYAKQARLLALRAQLKPLKPTDEAREFLKKRISRLAGGIGIVRIGAYSERERAQKKALAKKAVRVLEMALSEGVVPGGGVAYVEAIPSVLAEDCHSQGAKIVARALEAPFLQIAANSGSDAPRVVLASWRILDAGFGYDARTNTLLRGADFRIIDSVTVTCGALRAAASAAIMAMTTDVLVLQGDNR